MDKENEKANIVSANVKETIFFPRDHSNDTLYFNVSIDDCGEWGGPKEEFIIYIDSSDTYQLNYKRYRFNCDSIGVYADNRKKLLEFEKTITLDDPEKKVISDFLLDLMQAKIEEEIDSNAGSAYQVFKSDSTLMVDVASTKKDIELSYYKFKSNLSFPQNRKKDNSVPAP